MRIASQQVIDSARGAACQARFPGICNGDPATTVWCHLNGHAFGKGAMIKSHDVLGFHGCYACHCYYDVGHGTKPLLTPADLNMAVLQAVCMTWVELIRLEIIKVPQDRRKPASERKATPRKPKAERAKVPEGRPLPAGRKLPSRPMRVKP